MTINKTSLENLIEILDDPTVSTCEDIDASAQATSEDRAISLRFLPMISDVVGRMRRREMERALADQKVRVDAVNANLLKIQSRGYSDDKLRSMIAKRGRAGVGHRDLKNVTTADLESLLADVMANNGHDEE